MSKETKETNKTNEPIMSFADDSFALFKTYVDKENPRITHKKYSKIDSSKPTICEEIYYDDKLISSSYQEMPFGGVDRFGGSNIHLLLIAIILGQIAILLSHLFI